MGADSILRKEGLASISWSLFPCCKAKPNVVGTLTTLLGRKRR
jgi:hypothetical protein